MTEEPYRWVEAIQNRREYIEHQLGAGSPIAALSCADGILLLTVSRERQKLFEIYDRIAMGGIGHPADLERLRMSAIEVASAEGFNRSARDVSLRRLATYSLSPALKNAFEQIYGPPFLARMLFAELGRNGEPDVLLRLDYDGTFHAGGNTGSNGAETFAVIAGREHSGKRMEQFLRGKKFARLSHGEALPVALDAWTVGHMAQAEEESELPALEALAAHREAQLREGGVVEALLIDRSANSNAAVRVVKV